MDQDSRGWDPSVVRKQPEIVGNKEERVSRAICMLIASL